MENTLDSEPTTHDPALTKEAIDRAREAFDEFAKFTPLMRQAFFGGDKQKALDLLSAQTGYLRVMAVALDEASVLMGDPAMFVELMQFREEDAAQRQKMADNARTRGVKFRIPAIAARLMIRRPRDFGFADPALLGKFEMAVMARRAGVAKRKSGGLSGKARGPYLVMARIAKDPRHEIDLRMIPRDADEWKWGPRVTITSRAEAEELFDALCKVYVYLNLRTKTQSDPEMVEDAKREVYSVRTAYLNSVGEVLLPFFEQPLNLVKQWARDRRKMHEKRARDFQENKDRAEAVVTVPRLVADLSWLYGGPIWKKIEEADRNLTIGPNVRLTEAELRDLHSTAISALDRFSTNHTEDGAATKDDIASWKRLAGNIEGILPDLKASGTDAVA